ncbi:SprT-like domain-containing protein [Gilvibacter sp.]|uniref:SprT-like domain-containing protein n=1 Tax=Gilvibacter sp. TaxID=2729997 RepID=UPI0025BD060C|nr:SprT-like domain-containing protein [Gilvibacter sp.]NQX76746.1 SprT-like domain-containing protein [Gilvibacter sp.]
MDAVLEKYIPSAAVPLCVELIKKNGVHLKIVNQRVTRHGDYRQMPDGSHQITVNAGTNPYRFLITLVHEIAHLVAFKTYSRRIKPHGKEWKRTFTSLMLPFINTQVFPSELLPLLALHFKNPKASSDTDARLALALGVYDPPSDDKFIFEIPFGGVFRLYNGKIFKRGNRRVKRYECVELATGRMYLFSPNAKVEPIS